MGRRRVRRALASVLGLATALLVASCARPPRAPDLVIITVDTLRLDHLGFAGYDAARTPRLDALAREGTWLAEATTPMPRTTQALGSLMTGLWPAQHGSRVVGVPIQRGPTLAERLSRRGYLTLGVSPSGVAGPRQALDRGFRHFVDSVEIRRRHPDIYADGSDVTPDGRGWAEVTTEEAMRLVEERGDESPLLLWVHYWDPHTLYRPPSPWQDVAAPRCWETYQTFTVEHPELVWKPLGDFEGAGRYAVDDCRRLYDAEIAFTDHEIGRLLDAAERVRGRPALVVFTADHGENFGEEGSFFEHGDNVHDSVLRVPLVVAGPGVAAGRVDHGTANLVDVAPTLLSLLGVGVDEQEGLAGRDLSSRLAEAGRPLGSDDGRPTFAESGVVSRNQFFGTLLTGRGGQRACINGPRFTLCDVFEGRSGPPQLFDHEADPGLSRDVAANHPEVVERLLRARAHWPPGEGRIRTARTPRFKLVQRPRLDGGWDESLYDLQASGESEDVIAQHPAEAARLRQALVGWAPELEGAAPPVSAEVEESLRSLGYIR